MFNILDKTYVITIPTDPDELAVLLDMYSRDWANDLYFLMRVSRKQGITLDMDTVSNNIKKLQGIDEE